MPLAWTVTIYLSAALFGVTALVSARGRWLSIYLMACLPASIVWALQLWTVSRYIRPAILALQVAAVIEAVGLLHRNCWNPRRRYWLAGFLALCAVAGTFAAVEYPQYPKPLWWTQVWIEAAATVTCWVSLLLLAWWPSFRPAVWTIGNIATMGVYCGVELIAILWPVTKQTWLSVDVTLALIQDVCLLWWCALYSRHF